MGFSVRLLIVEDNSAERETWKHVIEIHNSQTDDFGFDIKESYAVSLPEALDLLSKGEYDAAVVDIRLEQSGANGPNADGNAVVEKMLDSELAVIAVFTGETDQVNTPKWAQQLVKNFRKGGDEGEGTPAVMKWLVEQAPMVQQIQKATLAIKKEMVQLFTRSIWPRWSNWTATKDGMNDDTLDVALSRHLVSHVHAVLLEDSKQRVHPEEWYFIPPIRSGLRTGDLIKNANGNYEIVITPRCDLALDKNETLQLAECKIVLEEWTKRCDKVRKCKEQFEAEQDNKKKDGLRNDLSNAEESLRKYTQHANNKASCHFLPQMKLADGTSLGPFMIQFDKVRSVESSKKEEIPILLENRVASVTPEFLPSIVERLGGFFSRIGTPDYSHFE